MGEVLVQVCKPFHKAYGILAILLSARPPFIQSQPVQVSKGLMRQVDKPRQGLFLGMKEAVLLVGRCLSAYAGPEVRFGRMVMLHRHWAVTHKNACQAQDRFSVG